MLKKKYRQMLQERDARPPRADGDAQGRPSPGTAPWEVTDAQVSFTSAPSADLTLHVSRFLPPQDGFVSSSAVNGGHVT